MLTRSGLGAVASRRDLQNLELLQSDIFVTLIEFLLLLLLLLLTSRAFCGPSSPIHQAQLYTSQEGLLRFEQWGVVARRAR